MRYITTTLLVLFSVVVLGQNPYPQDAFRSPVDIPIYLAGTFAELRSNHFHSGIDIKTESVIGKKIYAIADGYVSRIKISPYGFGKAIYIRHPNGYTSVYAHLDAFQGALIDVVKQEQYRRKSFAMDYFPEAGSIQVSKGQVIALSGNSGSSGGPHLHFEIRDTRTEHPINPLLFGFQVKDHIKPTIKAFYLYDFADGMTGKRSKLDLSNLGSHYKLKHHDTLSVPPQFYFGLNAIDKLDGFPNQNGLYTYEVYSNDELIFNFTAKEFSFARTRYLNAYIDFGYFKEASSRIQRSYVDPNNHLNMYGEKKDNGLFSLQPGETRNILIKAKDYKGNERTIKFVVKQDRAVEIDTLKKNETLFKWDQNNIYKNEGIEFTMPRGILYRDIRFSTSMETQNRYSYSNVYHLHTDHEPLHSYAILKIKPSVSIPDNLRSKVCIVSKDGKGNLSYEGGKWEGEYLNVKTRSFGSYYISADTIAPTLVAKNVYNGKNINGQSSIDFSVSDDLSGVTQYKAQLDGKWILMEYDPKNNRLFYLIDAYFPQGEHKLLVQVSDAKGNSSSISLQLSR